MNLKIRFKNVTFWVAFAPTVIAFIYQMLAIFNMVPKVSEDMVTQFIMMAINILAGLGILVDPTTKGLGDSQKALTYNKLGE